jgi:hypothetical protein
MSVSIAPSPRTQVRLRLTKGNFWALNYSGLSSCNAESVAKGLSARLDAPGTLHHVIIRGIEKGHIVDDQTDRENFGGVPWQK